MTPAPASDPVRDELHTFYDDSFAALLSTSPEVASEIGVVKIGRHRIPQDAFSDISAAGETRRRNLMSDTLKRLEALTATSTRSPREDLNRQIYEFFLRWGNFGRLRGTEGHGFEHCESIADHLCGVQTELVTCLAQWQRLDTAEDADCFVSRLEAVPRQIDALIEGLRSVQAAGNVMPAASFAASSTSFRNCWRCPRKNSRSIVAFLESGRTAAARSVATSLNDGFLPAYRRLHDVLTTRLSPGRPDRPVPASGRRRLLPVPPESAHDDRAVPSRNTCARHGRAGPAAACDQRETASCRIWQWFLQRAVRGVQRRRAFRSRSRRAGTQRFAPACGHDHP